MGTLRTRGSPLESWKWTKCSIQSSLQYDHVSLRVGQALILNSGKTRRRTSQPSRSILWNPRLGGLSLFSFPYPKVISQTNNLQCYWSLQDGNSTSTWSDALLTPLGKFQALSAHAFWTFQLTLQKQPAPESYYTSPLLRCMATASLTFSNLELPADRPFKPLIKELIREAIGVHTCDRRSSKTIIAKHYPNWEFESGFSEEDPLWDAELRETNEAMDRRLRQALDEIFESDNNTYISISSHSGAIGSVLRGTFPPLLFPSLCSGEWMREMH